MSWFLGITLLCAVCGVLAWGHWLLSKKTRSYIYLSAAASLVLACVLTFSVWTATHALCASSSFVVVVLMLAQTNAGMALAVLVGRFVEQATTSQIVRRVAYTVPFVLCLVTLPFLFFSDVFIIGFGNGSCSSGTYSAGGTMEMQL